MDGLKVLSVLSIISTLAIFGFGCKETQSPELEALKDLFFDLQVGEVTIQTELAILPEERHKGLMHRDRLEDGEGMFFVFENAAPQRFWMKNTRIPLDIGYFSPEGILLEVHAAKPFDLTGVPSRSKKVQFVLELNQGDFRKLGIRIGDRIQLREITKMIVRRGLPPEDYGLTAEEAFSE